MNFTTDNLVFDPELLRRYDVNGPRYTSYPTADRFTEAFNAESYKAWLGKRDADGVNQPLSLYFHIPFCNTICYYCGCNKIITKDHGRSAKYIRYLAKEIALQTQHLSGERKVTQLHFGGGTPTFLSDDEMRLLWKHIRDHFELTPDGEYSIEVDPRKVGADNVAVLGEMGFNRMSLGVQDFDEKVQVAVNRVQSEEETLTVMRAARANGFNSISIDLIYGLPHQTVEGFDRTLDRILSADPDRLAIYNYAHLPHLFKPQRRIAEADLPSPDAKMQILALAIRKLTEAGYVFIGMDHFAKPNDELAVAQREGRLHRNFQGYSTHAECEMLAFGISSIAKLGPTYGQSVKTLDEYYERLDQGILPVYRGIELTPDDVLRRDVITQLMCHFELSFKAVEAKYKLKFREYFATELSEMGELEAGGLVRVEPERIVVLPAGRMLVRIVAMKFDAWLRRDQEKKRYSKVI
jgi:oxygen-independent coproporphyrinogen III oxidase